MAANPRLILIAFLPVAALAAETHVPQDLQDWQEWVLHDKEYLDCPFLYDRAAAGADDFICAWPGRLTLSVDPSGGRFTQQWTVHADEQWVGLPGSTEYWPHQVTPNGRRGFRMGRAPGRVARAVSERPGVADRRRPRYQPAGA